MVTLKQVAARAGVSPATVSRVLSGSGQVQPEYRERVLRAAAELGYRPNRLASSLRRRKTEKIGIVVSDIENPHFTQMVRVVEDAAYHRGYRVLLCNTDEMADKQRAYLHVLADERVEGVILAPADPAGAGIAELLGMGIPIVAFDRAVDDQRADAVVADNAGGARRATELLLDAGHTRIGFVGGREEIQTGRERRAGYKDAMRRRQATAASVEDGGFRIDGGEAATHRLLDADPRLSALVIANNLMAVGAFRALRARGLHVPDDVAFVTIDDPYWASLVDPPLTALAQPVDGMARAAVDLLFERVEGNRTTPRSVVFSFDLRLRASCGTAIPRYQPPGLVSPERQPALTLSTRPLPS